MIRFAAKELAMLKSLIAFVILLATTACALADFPKGKRKLITSYSGPVVCKGPAVEYKIATNGQIVEFWYYEHDPRRIWVGQQGGWSQMLGNNVSCQISGTESYFP